MLDPGLAGKVALVTGGNHGIGAATAQALAAQGARVFIQYLHFPETASTKQPEAAEPLSPGEPLYHRFRARTAEGVLQAIRQQGGQAEAWEADLCDPATIPLLFDRAEAAFGPVSVVVNNAAHWEADSFTPPAAQHDPRGPEVWPPQLLSLTPEIHDRHFAINSRAVALMMAEFARRHVARGATWGRIINISTDGAPIFPAEVSYGASKYALESYSRSAAAELGKYGITVNIVSPGPIQTGWIAPELEQVCIASSALKRIGQPEDVADVIVFLASGQARWLTGQCLFVGGGHRMF